jgi:hypothetical protein
MEVLGWVRIVEWAQAVQGQTWAAWAQAFGTFGALLLTQRIASSQWRRHEEVESLRKTEGIKATLTLILRGEAIIRGGASIKPQSGLPMPLPTGAVLHSLGVIANHLESFTFLSSPSVALVRTSLSSANEIRKALTVYERAADGKVLDLARLTSCADELQKGCDHLKQLYGINE